MAGQNSLCSDYHDAVSHSVSSRGVEMWIKALGIRHTNLCKARRVQYLSLQGNGKGNWENWEAEYCFIVPFVIPLHLELARTGGCSRNNGASIVFRSVAGFRSQPFFSRLLNLSDLCLLFRIIVRIMWDSCKTLQTVAYVEVFKIAIIHVLCTQVFCFDCSFSHG